MKRTLFILLLSMAGVIAAFYDAFYGILLYTWYSFASPLSLTYGQLDALRLSFVVAIVVILTTGLQYRRFFIWNATTFFSLFFLFLSIFSLAATMQYNIQSILLAVNLLAKLIIISLIIPVVLISIGRLELYINCIVVSGGLLAAYYGVFGLFAGSTSISGPARIGDNNGYAVFLCSLLPFFFVSHPRLETKAVRFGLFGLFLANLVAIMLTFSRTGIIVAAGVILLLLMRLQNRIFAIIFVLGFLTLGTAVYSGLDEVGTYRVTEVEEESVGIIQETLELYRYRLSTLREEGENISSLISRMHFWKVAFQMAKHSPVFGVGLGNYRNRYNDFDDSGGEHGTFRSVHSTPFSVLAETGFLGFFIFISIFLSCCYSQLRAKAIARRYGTTEEFRRIKRIVQFTQISMIGFFVGSFFVVALYQEILWAFVTISISLEVVSRNMLQEGV